MQGNSERARRSGYLRQDDRGNWYLIPLDRLAEFNDLEYDARSHRALMPEVSGDADKSLDRDFAAERLCGGIERLVFTLEEPEQ